MTPPARTEAAIGLLEQILSHPVIPADRLVAGWFRQRRYAGAKDRAYITNLVFSVLRRRAELEWALGRDDIGQAGARDLTVAALVLDEQLSDTDVADRFTGALHAPMPLTAAERGQLASMRRDFTGAPDWVRGNYPPSLDAAFREVFGDDVAVEIPALADRAPVDLRVNTLRASREQAIAALAKEGIAAQPTPLSPVGLRLDARANLAASDAFRTGLVEVQDEGSQLIALLLGAQPGETVVDWCAGGGGKALAVAAAMHNEGRLLAFDISAERLESARHRIDRAGASMITTHLVDQPPEVVADRVLVDAPCSGSGAWRRNPAAKWRTSPATIAEFAQRQADILDTAAHAVRPGGVLLYATCSLFRAENHDQVDAFLRRHRDFRLGSIAAQWRRVIDDNPPSEMPLLLLTPFENKTDGFFMALFERKANA
jgi:16S rRNA (cytosine967-C5)-methyltransferase